MPAPEPTEPTPGSPSENARELPRWGFWKGLLVGTVLEIPAISAAVLLWPRLGLGEAAPVMAVVRMTSLFAGLPALITSGGIGRLAAHESVQRRRRAAIGRAAGVHALAGILLTMIAALPHGYVPANPLQWLLMAGLGMAAGSLCGAVIGVACTGAPPRQVTEMIELVKRPGLTLRQLVELEDLGRIGAAVRNRASQMFDGLLDPAEPRPAEDPVPEVGAGQRTGGVARHARQSDSEGGDAARDAVVVGGEGANGPTEERRGTGEPRA